MKNTEIQVRRTDTTEYMLQLSKMDILEIIRQHMAHVSGIDLSSDAVNCTVATMGGDLQNVTCTLTVDHNKMAAAAYHGEERRREQSKIHPHRRSTDAALTKFRFTEFTQK